MTVRLRPLRHGARVTAALFVAGVLLGAPVGSASAQSGIASIPSSGSSETIQTAAGTGQRGSSGDGLPAVQAELNDPSSVAVDNVGSLYIADSGNNEIRKVVDPALAGDDIINTVAGTGVPGFGGDNGPAITAMLRHPDGVAVDSADDLFIADTGNNRIREVLANGIIKTVAGDGTCKLLSVPGYGGKNPYEAMLGDGGPATSASLCGPTGVAVDSAGNIYIADAGHHTVRVVDRTGTISTYAGTGAIGRSGDGGPAKEAELGHPVTVIVGSTNNVYIADALENNVREVNSAGIISTIAGERSGGFWGPSIAAAYWGGRAPRFQLDDPRGLGVDQMGDVFVGDTGHNRILEVSAGGRVSVFAGTGRPGYSGDGGPATKARLFRPQGSFALDPTASQTSLYFADTGNQRVRGILGGPSPVLPETSNATLFLVGAAVIFCGAAVVTLKRRRRAAG